MESFSRRHGYNRPSEVKITVRQDAPHEFRGVMIELAYDCGFGPSTLRKVICKALRKRPDRSNWSERPNIDDENHYLIDDCQWYKVYDVVEAIYKFMKSNDTYEPKKFENELNEYFTEAGIGWQLKSGVIESRGPEVYEALLNNANSALDDSDRHTARGELHEAIADLSRRPKPDITGAIQHSMASLECVARECCNDPKATLGEIINRYGGLISPPLDRAISKIWGYASENARHVREGREPTHKEAELIVGLCASVSTYLCRQKRV